MAASLLRPGLLRAALLVAAWCAAGEASEDGAWQAATCRGQACSEDDVAGAEDALAASMHFGLLQRQMGLSPLAAPAAAEGSLLAAMPSPPFAALLSSGASQPAAINCTEYPMFCDPKVNCASNPMSSDEIAQLNGRLATPSGHANLRTWCLAYPHYGRALKTCILDNDKVGYADATFADQQAAGLDTADAMYCYVEGHCNDTRITDETTVSQAEEACDEKYGHEAWTQVGWHSVMEIVHEAPELYKEQMEALAEGRTTMAAVLQIIRNKSRTFGLTACAMGNYQCDVINCRRNYCGNDRYKAFANWAWAA